VPEPEGQNSPRPNAMTGSSGAALLAPKQPV
jgi:hypothetical protein